MGLRLSVRHDAWRRGIDAVAAGLPGLIPVVKGNGYGFGRAALMPIAEELTDVGGQVAVGTVYEAGDVGPNRTALVLTPHIDSMPSDVPGDAILTVGSVAHIDALQRRAWAGSVSVKLASSMHRYGTTPADLVAMSARIASAGCTTASYSVHLPLAGSSAEHRDEIAAWLPHLDPTVPLTVSHLDASAYAALRAEHPDRAFGIRCGTALWHGDKSLLSLTADVLDLHQVDASIVAGYRATAIPCAGTLVLVAAGSAHGMAALDDGRSPFHFARRRLPMLEPPHMHTTMLFVPDGDPVPAVGERVDVQRPLILTSVDEFEWLSD